MKAARLYRPYQLREEEVPEPGPPPPGWVRLRVASVGICGSDLHSGSQVIGDKAYNYYLIEDLLKERGIQLLPMCK